MTDFTALASFDEEAKIEVSFDHFSSNADGTYADLHYTINIDDHLTEAVMHYSNAYNPLDFSKEYLAKGTFSKWDIPEMTFHAFDAHKGSISVASRVKAMTMLLELDELTFKRTKL